MLGEVAALGSEMTSDHAITEGEGIYEPAALYNSSDILFNLTWSPLGDALLFASKPAMTTAALFGSPMHSNVATLYSLDLSTLELSVLVEQTPKSEKDSAELSLT